jgi:NhaA family Na+:H+ antiporter
LVLPVRCRTVRGQVEEHSVGERLEHLVRPASAAVAVPVFALFAAGVTVGGGNLGRAVADPVFTAIVAALVVGKCLGVLGGAWVTARFTHAELDDDLAWVDILGLSLLAGIGFTVSLLIGELAFGSGSERDDHVKLAVLTGSLLAALLAIVVLRLRNRVYRRLWEEETRDDDQDGIPDVYEQRQQASPGASP